jgi:hypothetical protein
MLLLYFVASFHHVYDTPSMVSYTFVLLEYILVTMM